MLIIRLIVAALLLAGAAPALAQSNPGFSYGQVPTAGQWNSYFSGKQDVLGFIPLNTAGGTLTGPLFLAPSTAIAAGLNIAPGVAPAAPNNGDIWTSQSGIFVEINGQAVGPLLSGNTLPSISTPGSVYASIAPSNEFATGINTSGSVTYAQPSFLNISGTAQVNQGGTGATTSSAALTALGAAGTGSANTFAGLQTFLAGAATTLATANDNSTKVASTAWVSTCGNVGGTTQFGGIDYVEVDCFPGRTGTDPSNWDDMPRFQAAYNALCARSPQGGIIHLRAERYYMGTTTGDFGQFDNGPSAACTVVFSGVSPSDSPLESGTWFYINSTANIPFSINSINTPLTQSTGLLGGFAIEHVGIYQVQPTPPGGLFTFITYGGTSSGTANAQIVTTSSASGPFLPTPYYVIIFTAGATNTGSATLTETTSGTTETLYTSSGSTLPPGALVAGSQYVAIWSTGKFTLYPATGSWTPTVYPPVVFAGTAGTLTLHDINASPVYQFLYETNSGHLELSSIRADCFYQCFNIDGTYASVHLGWIDMSGYWSQNPFVENYTYLNTDGFYIGQMDGLSGGDIGGINMRSIFHLVKGYGSGLSLFIHRAVLNSLYADGTYRAIWAENSVGSAGLTYPQEILLNEMHAVCLNIITLTGQPGSAAILADTTGSIDIAIGSLDIAACGTNATDFPIRAINPNIQSNIRIGNLQSDSLNTPVAGFVTITGTPGYGSAEQSHFSVGSLPMTNITSLNDLGANPWGSLNSLATVQIPQLDNYTLTLVSNGSTLPLSWVYKSFAINGTSNPTTGLIIKLPGSYPWDGETVTVKAITNPLTGITFETVDGTNIPSTVTSIAGGQHVTFTYSSLIAGWQVSQ